jgi:hypothetical protein
VNIELEPAEASTVAETLLRLAALIDPDDPDGLRDAFGQRREELERDLLLTGTQFEVLRRPSYRSDERVEVAEHLREVSAKIEGQLPDEAPEIWHGPRRPGPTSL